MLSAPMNRVPASKWDKLHGTILYTSEELTSGLEWLKTGRPNGSRSVTKLRPK